PSDSQARDGLDIAFTVTFRSESEAADAPAKSPVPAKNAEVHNNLGIALLEIGRTDEAIRAFQAAVALAPRNAAAYLNLAGSRRSRAADPHFAAMKELARDMGSLEVEDRIKLHFALAKAFADVGEARESARHLVEGNALKRRQITYDEAGTL